MLYNESDIDLSVAVWLATDTYEHDDTVISATGLIKPIKQTVLAARVPATKKMGDVVNNLASSIGTAIHDSIENAWVNHYETALASMGYNKAVIASIMVNPTDDDVKANPDKIFVYTEKRVKKSINGVTISGEYDFCAEGRVEDFKSTGTFTYEKGVKVDDHRLQGSIYRWLDPTVITQDVMSIQFIFKDWKQNLAKTSNTYPKAPVVSQTIELLSYEDTEKWITERINKIQECMDLPEEQLPRCTEKELWQDKAVYKYFADPLKTTGRSTKNFDSSQEAENRRNGKGKGVVIPVMGKVRACNYCDGFMACKQKDEYVRNGTLA
jgi:hypothetical protein